MVFRIRRIFDDLSPANEKAIARIREILKEQFPGVRPEEGESIPEKLRNQLKYGFQTILFAAERGAGNVHGFALALHDLILKFCYPDYVAVTGRDAGGGLGGGLYERVRKETRDLGCIGLFFECLPDASALSCLQRPLSPSTAIQDSRIPTSRDSRIKKGKGKAGDTTSTFPFPNIFPRRTILMPSAERQGG